MSRTKRGGKGCGEEYWSRRPSKTREPGEVAKKSTRKRERQQARVEAMKEHQDKETE